ncbi:MAG: phytanoyl-CoA dioxygenase family protein [Kofleriaceae bacterium]|jgi:hypothetical protein|nr:phytanoyl-CoA dioxygenase family protein [Kofleriaceae bacterium]MBP6838393.1 phytanoyl-CoA dioxygenase family protein [Kofleriaceae bacterium]
MSTVPEELDHVVTHFHQHGWARLGPLLPPAQADALAARAAAIMAGTVDGRGLFFQHDAPSGRYDDLELGRGWIGPSPAYRKIERLERDPVFRAWIEAPALAPVVRAIVGDTVSLYRAVLWTKAARQGEHAGGTELPWHQDGGAFWGVTPAPILTIWTALDDAPVQAGCVELIPGSHHGGLATPEGGTVPDALIAGAGARLLVPARRGDVLLLHNLVWHRSGRNHTAAPRRALSVCYQRGDARCLRRKHAPRTFVPLF